MHASRIEDLADLTTGKPSSREVNIIMIMGLLENSAELSQANHARRDYTILWVISAYS